MVRTNREGALVDTEKAIIKRLLREGKRNQDIQAQINFGRKHTINSARITEVKQDPNIIEATDKEFDAFKRLKRSFDPLTELNSIEDERLIRSRESMMLVISLFNNPIVKFRTEVFFVLVNIA